MSDSSQGLSYFTSPTVQVVVGGFADDPVQTFYVHAALIASRSSFFAKALKSYTKAGGTNDDQPAQSSISSMQWREGEEGVVKLLVDEPEVFAAYAQLLYTGMVPNYDGPKGPVGDKSEDEKRAHDDEIRLASDKMYSILGKLYVFCEKIQDTSAKPILLAAFVDAAAVRRGNGTRYYPVDPTVTDVYSGTSPSDPLRSFLVDSYVYIGWSEWIPETYDDLPHEFLFEVVAGMFKVREAPEDYSRLQDKQYYLDQLKGQKSDGDEDVEDGG